MWTFPIQGQNISPIPTPQTAGFGKLTCKGKVFTKNTTDNVNYQRYVLGKRYAIRMRLDNGQLLSEGEVLRETSIIESNLSLFLFAYLKLLEISTINIFSCMNIRTQREYRVNLNSPSTLSNELKRTACAHNLQASKDDIHPSTSK